MLAERRVQHRIPARSPHCAHRYAYPHAVITQFTFYFLEFDCQIRLILKSRTPSKVGLQSGVVPESQILKVIMSSVHESPEVQVVKWLSWLQTAQFTGALTATFQLRKLWRNPYMTTLPISHRRPVNPVKGTFNVSLSQELDSNVL